MANKLMRYKGSRGSEFRYYIGKILCLECLMFGYAECWYTNVGSFVTTVKHVKMIEGKQKTVKRCWLGL